MDGLERLEKEAVEMNNHNVILIFNYIKEKESLRDKFNNEEKTIKGMYEFICNKARTVSQNNVAMIQDNIVYLWAMAYFNKTNEELGINKKVSPPQTKKLDYLFFLPSFLLVILLFLLQFSLFEEVKK